MGHETNTQRLFPLGHSQHPHLASSSGRTPLSHKAFVTFSRTASSPPSAAWARSSVYLFSVFPSAENESSPRVARSHLRVTVATPVVGGRKRRRGVLRRYAVSDLTMHTPRIHLQPLFETGALVCHWELLARPTIGCCLTVKGCLPLILALCSCQAHPLLLTCCGHNLSLRTAIYSPTASASASSTCTSSVLRCN